MDLIDVDPELLMSLDKPVPRYTSYPTAIHFQKLPEEAYAASLRALSCTDPLSLYIHIPFCKSMCLFCGCSVILNRDPQKQILYLQALLQEIDLIASHLPAKKPLSQLHFGGGTPTSLHENEFSLLMEKIQEHFFFAPSAEIAIEVDPRTVFLDQGRKLRFLHSLGFNRISFGVQDTDPKVQEAVRRRQSWEMTRTTFQWAKEIGFQSINIDLIYGLPLQTKHTFSDTILKMIQLKPDRIALFSYAKVPWLKPHQRAIREEDLPSTLEKFCIYVQARRELMKAGYVSIGMDHFALAEDSLAHAYQEKKLYRNFQGYSHNLADTLIGLGLSSIGFMPGLFVQNSKDMKEYLGKIQEKKLPTHRGRVLSKEDRIRRYVIQKLMCDFALDKGAFAVQWTLSFDAYFSIEKNQLQIFSQHGLLENHQDLLAITPLGRLFIRNIAAIFDAYLTQGSPGTFSQAV